MIAPIRYVALVPETYRHQEVKWLILEKVQDSKNGWFLFLHNELHNPSLYDSYHVERSGAENEAAAEWGISVADWRVFPAAQNI